jgi:hypothetical protein
LFPQYYLKAEVEEVEVEEAVEGETVEAAVLILVHLRLIIVYQIVMVTKLV